MNFDQLQESDRSQFLSDSNSNPMGLSLANNEEEQEQSNLNTNANIDINMNMNNSLPVEKEHMFDKVVTPSDVGKLNRLVIPKQHAEKYFPLDSSSNEKGLLLNFEDRNGKPWKFRYSYWNSSQSYVMTKGWSRFVKEKKLDAGDIVSFQRGVGETAKDRLFIDWRRRPDAVDPMSISQFNSFPQSFRWGRLYSVPQPNLNYGVYSYENNHNNHNNHNNNNHLYSFSPHHHHPHPHPQIHNQFRNRQHEIVGYGSNINMPPYMRSFEQTPIWAGQEMGNNNRVAPLVFDSVPVFRGKTPTPPASPKMLRLFGVNMECGSSNEEDIHQSNMPGGGGIMSSSTTNPLLFGSHQFGSSSSSSSSLRHPTPHLQLRLPMQEDHGDLQHSSKKGKSNLSFDLDL